MATTTAAPPRYTINKEQLQGYAIALILDLMVNGGKQYSVLLEQDASLLEPLFKAMMVQDLVTISGTNYVPTEKGRQVVLGYKQRYREYLDAFDYACAIDLGTGEFAFSRFYDDEFSPDNDPDGRKWQAYLGQPRWQDLRVPMAEFKGINPVDIVFMSFLVEKRLDTSTPHWEFDLLLGATFQQILDICNSNLHVDQLGYTEQETGKLITGEEVMRDVITQGTQLMFKLLEENQKRQKEYERQLAEYNAQQAQLQQEQAAAQTVETETVVETVEYVVDDPFVYYDPWYDPYYVSPIWTVPLWMLL